MINRGQSFAAHDAAWQLMVKGYELFGENPEMFRMFCQVINTLSDDPEAIAYNIIAEKAGAIKEVEKVKEEKDGETKADNSG